MLARPIRPTIQSERRSVTCTDIQSERRSVTCTDIQSERWPVTYTICLHLHVLARACTSNTTYYTHTPIISKLKIIIILWLYYSQFDQTHYYYPTYLAVISLGNLKSIEAHTEYRDDVPVCTHARTYVRTHARTHARTRARTHARARAYARASKAVVYSGGYKAQVGQDSYVMFENDGRCRHKG